MSTRQVLLVMSAVVLAACDEVPTAVDAAVADATSADVAAGGPPIIEILTAAGEVVTTVVYGTPIAVRVRDLLPEEAVTLRGELWGYRSTADFVVAADGTIDTARDAPVAGTYTGVEPDGLVWSMLKESNATARNYDVTLIVDRGGSEAARAVLQRQPMGYDATVTDVREAGLFGTLLVPAGVARPPVVVALGGSEGGVDGALWTGSYAETFGVAALALAYFDETGLPAALAEIPAEYVQGALDWLAARSDVDGARVVIWGGSRGSELALEVGARDARVRGVIAEAPSAVRWASVNDANVAAWTFGGAALPYLGDLIGAPVTENVPGIGIGYRYTPMFDATLDATSADSLAAASVVVEDVAGPILFLAGSDDGIWPSCRLADIGWARLQAAGHVADHGDAMHCYADAGHGVGPSGWPTAELYAVDTGSEILIVGGTAAGNARAEREGYFAVRDFFDRVFGR